MKLRKEVAGLPPEALAAPRIDRLILIDREVDLVTPLVTQVRGWAWAGGLLCGCMVTVWLCVKSKDLATVVAQLPCAPADVLPPPVPAVQL